MLRGESTTDYDIRVLLLRNVNHLSYISRRMLTICIELDGIVVTMFMGVAHARLECTCKTKVHWQIDNVIVMLPTNAKGIVLGAVIDDDIINPRRIATQIFNS